jgi:hypothetical protein
MEALKQDNAELRRVLESERAERVCKVTDEAVEVRGPFDAVVSHF